MYVIDNTVLANFAAIDYIDGLERILKGQSVVPYHVFHEFHNSQKFSGMTLNYSFIQIADEDLNLFTATIKNFGFSGLGKGELSCIYTVEILENAKIILTDDNLARKYCEKSKIEYHGSVYILALGVRKAIHSLDEAEKILCNMRECGFWLKDEITVESALKNL